MHSIFSSVIPHVPAPSHLSLRCSEPGHGQQSGRISCALSSGRQLWPFLTNEVTLQPKQIPLSPQTVLLSAMGTAMPSWVSTQHLSCMWRLCLGSASQRNFTACTCPQLEHTFQSLTSLTNSSALTEGDTVSTM